MHPVRTERSNFTFTAPHSAPDVGDLPCRREDGVIYSTWTLSHEERIAVAEGANIELGYWREGAPPPVSLSIDSTPIMLEPQFKRDKS